jgi:hypothetical protein
MSINKIWLSGLVAAFLSLGAVRGEGPPVPYDNPGDPVIAPPAGETAPVPPGTTANLSDWILYPRCPACCGPVGGNGPIGEEVYLRSGFDYTVGGDTFGKGLDTGWVIEGGARTLFFNPERDAAWAVDLGVSNIHNGSADRSRTFALFNLPTPTNNPGAAPPANPTLVSIRDLNRTYVNLSLGRERYLWGCADGAPGQPNLRIGVDFGGRYGTEKLEVTQITHRTDTIAGMFVSAHSDLEFPCGACVFQAGIRTEWGYTWADVLQRQNNSDVQDIQLLFTFGARF